MAYRFLHVGGVFASFPKTSLVDAALNGTGDEWIRYSNSNWIVWTARSAADLFAMLKPAFGLDDQVLIVEPNAKERNGWLSHWIWQWIDGKLKGQEQSLGDLLTDALRGSGLGAGGGGEVPKGLGSLARILGDMKPKS
jgi:hypothetical protein